MLFSIEETILLNMIKNVAFNYKDNERGRQNGRESVITVGLLELAKEILQEDKMRDWRFRESCHSSFINDKR